MGLPTEDDLPPFTDDAVTEASPYGVASHGIVQRFVLEVVEGPRCVAVWESIADRCSIGSHPSNDLALDDKTVSRFH